MDEPGMDGGRALGGVGDEGVDLWAVQPEDVEAGAAEHADDVGAVVPAILSNASPDDLRLAWRDGDSAARRALLEQVLGDASPAARQAARQLLEVGSVLGLSCEVLLDALDRP